MPVNRAYDDPEVEKTIQLIMQQSGVPRAEAIRMYKMLAQSPDTMGPRNQMSILGDAGGLRPHRSPVISGYPGDSGIDDAETEGIDSPTNPIVEQANQPSLAPGEERVVEDSAQQGDVGPMNMAQLMSGGQSLHGEPVTKISRGEKVAGVLQALASAGQSYFGGRDIKAADKRGREGTARANLINALAGNQVAQAPRASARPGAVTSALGGLSKAAGEYVRQREAQKALDQQAMLTKLTQPKLGSGTAGEKSLGVSFYESGAHTASKWDAERNTDEYVGGVQSFLSGNLKRALAQTGSSTLRQALLAQARKGFRETLAKRVDEKARTEATAGGKSIIATSKFFRAAGETHSLKDEPSNFQGSVDQWEQDTGDTLTPKEKTDLYASYHEGRTTGLGKGMTSPMSVAQMYTSVKHGAVSSAQRGDGRSFTSFMREYPSIENFAKRVKGGFDIKNLELEYYGAYDDEKADLTTLPTWAKKEVAAINASIIKTRVLEQAWVASDWRGPLMGRLPIFQYFTPDDAQYDKLREAFVLDLAAVINAGRPSDKDAEAIGKLIPLRSDTVVVAGGVFDTLRQMLLAKKGAIESEFHLPIWNYVNEEDHSFNVAAYQEAVQNRQLSAEDVADMAEAMNDPSAKSAADIERVKDLRINFLKAFDAAGVAYTTQGDGLIVVTTAGQVGDEADPVGNQDIKTFLQNKAKAGGQG